MPELMDIGSVPVIEKEIYQGENAFFPSVKLRETAQKRLITEAFKFHYGNNRVYRAYCENKGVSLQNVMEDCRKIPLIPSTVFKTMNIRTETGELTVKKCLSSGTQGSVSTIERDNTTLERFLGSVRNTLDNVYQIEDAIILNLGPSAQEAKDIWFSYVMSVSDMIFPTLDYVEGARFMTQKVTEDLRKFKGKYRDVFVIGAPAMFIELHEYFKKHSLPSIPGENIFIITAGGWKKHEGKSVPRKEFNRICGEMFSGIEKCRIRDVFNMVELNTIIPECGCGSKHLPVWLDVYSINLDTYGINQSGENGLLGFLDASPASYPGFIMSGDLGRITHIDDCPCGRDGICIEITRRINTIESRGCALKIEKNLKKNNS